jgi:Xaa-Pro aminopeptidase
MALKIPDVEYKARVNRIQEEMELAGLDLLIGYSSESEPHHVRYVADFNPRFDFAAFIIPKEGEAALLAGGPESIVYARATSRLKKVYIHPFLVETSAPIDFSSNIRFKDIIPDVTGGLKLRRVGIVGANIFPHILYEDLRNTVKGCEITEADDILYKVRLIKSENEVRVMEEASRIAEKALAEALEFLDEGKSELEVENRAKSAMFLNGAESTAYPIWVCSGKSTNQGLSKSTDKKLSRNELIQLSIGAKYQGYCGNMCRPLTIGEPPSEAKKLMEVGLEIENLILDAMSPGADAKAIYELFRETLTKHGFGKESTLYGPAHSTGLQECAGPWIDGSKFTLEPGMVYNVDIWLSKGEIGLRWEDGIAMTSVKGKQLSSYRREIITK